MGIPRSPAQWTALSDADVRDVAADFGAHVSAVAQIEINRRLIAALVSFRRSSERASRRLLGLTLVLVALTGVLVWLTLRLE